MNKLIVILNILRFWPHILLSLKYKDIIEDIKVYKEEYRLSGNNIYILFFLV